MASPRARGAWIPWLFVGFFLVVIVVNGTMVYFATISWTGLETESPYDKGLRYNENLEAARLQQALGWTPQLRARIVQGYLGEVELSLLDGQGQPLTGAEVVARLERPGEQAVDFELPLLAVEPGLYRARVDLPRIGSWRVHLTVRRGQDLFVRDELLVLE